ncbi:unnamed protein product, partial [marine sediment metagenome]
PDFIYPQIKFAEDKIYWYNTREFLPLYKDSYHIFKYTNNYTVNANTSFWIEFDSVSKSETVKGLQVYLFDRTTNITDFQSDWVKSLGSKAELVAEISTDQAKNHNHTQNSSHYLITLTANEDGTIGTNNLNVTDSFWVVLYSAGTTEAKCWNMSYRRQDLCNTSNWWIGEAGVWTTTAQYGCPDTHVHVARRNISGSSDGVAMQSCGADNFGNINCTVVEYEFFGALPNLAPVANAITNPVSSNTYSCPINITWYAFHDPNGDVVIY